MLEDELGVYFTEGLNLNTIVVMLSPKPELTVGKLSLGKVVTLTILPMWFLVMASLFSNLGKGNSLFYFGTVFTLYLSWYLGIPAPDGWSVIRTQYPHRAFAMLLLVPLLKDMRGNKNIIILVSTLIWLSVEPELYLDPIFRYEHAARGAIACMFFLFAIRIQDYFSTIAFDLEFIRKWGGITLSLIILGFWSSFNIVKFPNSDFGIMFFVAMSMLVLSVILTKPSDISIATQVTVLSISIGVLSGHFLDLSLGNYHRSSFLFCSLLISFGCYRLMALESFHRNGTRVALWVLMGLLMINAIIHVVEPSYVTPLMIPGFSEL